MWVRGVRVFIVRTSHNPCHQLYKTFCNGNYIHWFMLRLLLQEYPTELYCIILVYMCPWIPEFLSMASWFKCPLYVLHIVIIGEGIPDSCTEVHTACTIKRCALVLHTRSGCWKLSYPLQSRTSSVKCTTFYDTPCTFQVALKVHTFYRRVYI